MFSFPLFVRAVVPLFVRHFCVCTVVVWMSYVLVYDQWILTSITTEKPAHYLLNVFPMKISIPSCRHKLNTTCLIYLFIYWWINNLYCAYNTKHFCVILVWRTSQTTTRGSHPIQQSAIFIWCVIIDWFSIFVHAYIIIVVMTFVWSHKKPRIFCIPSTIACRFTWNKTTW